MQAPCLPGYPFGMFKRTLAWAAGLIAVLALVLGGYFTYAAAQKRTQQRQVAEMVRDALALKKRVETDYFELGITLKATDDLLFKLQDSERRLEPRVGTDSLLEAAVVVSARKQAQDEARRATDELNQLRRIGP